MLASLVLTSLSDPAPVDQPEILPRWCLTPPAAPVRFWDVRESDVKEVYWNASGITIKPYNSTTQSWTINSAAFDKGCSTAVNFNVPGFPGKPLPGPLLMKMAGVACLKEPAPPPCTNPPCPEVTHKKGEGPFPPFPPTRSTQRAALLFSDPNGSLIPKGVPGNAWYAINKNKMDACVV